MKTKKNKKNKKNKKTINTNKYKKFTKRGGYLEIDDRLRLQENEPIPSLNAFYFRFDDSETPGIKASFIVKLKNAVISLDEINGFNLEGIIEEIVPYNNFILESLKPNLVIGKNFNIYDIEFLRDNRLGFEYSREGIEKILEAYKKLLQSSYPNITWFPSIDQGALYFYCPPYNYADGSKYYKIHICVKAEAIEITIKNLISILCKYKSLFNQCKMPLPRFTPFYDVRDEYARKYLKWYCGTAAANIVLYVNKQYDYNPKQFEFMLNQFISEWIEMGADKYGRELNNLYFNKRISKSLYIGYGSDSYNKCEELDKLLKNDITVRQFKMSNNLKQEQDKLCIPNYSDLLSYNMLNSCLLDTYNISYSDLCDKDNYGAKDVWVRKEMPEKNEITIGNKCYDKI